MAILLIHTYLPYLEQYYYYGMQDIVTVLEVRRR